MKQFALFGVTGEKFTLVEGPTPDYVGLDAKLKDACVKGTKHDSLVLVDIMRGLRKRRKVSDAVVEQSKPSKKKSDVYGN